MTPRLVAATLSEKGREGDAVFTSRADNGTDACHGADRSDAAGPYNPLQIGQWRGGAYTHDQTGAFSHCAAAVGYQADILMIVGVDRALAWSLGFASKRWTLAKGESIPIQLRFDNGTAYPVTGIVMAPEFVRVPMPDDSVLIRDFRIATLMNAMAKGESANFRLDGTARLLPALVNCVRTALLDENNKSARPSTEATIEEMQLATNFLLAARLPNARVMSRTETPAALASLGAAWQADGAVGGVKIYASKPGQTGLELASELIARHAQSCQGKFGSGRSSELIDSDVVVQALVSCSDSKGELTITYYITPWA